MMMQMLSMVLMMGATPMTMAKPTATKTSTMVMLAMTKMLAIIIMAVVMTG